MLSVGSGADLGLWGVLAGLLGAGRWRGRRVAEGGRRAPAVWVLPLCFAVLLTAGLAQAAPVSDEAPKLRYANDLHGNFALIGNTLGQDCRTTTPRPLIGTMPPNTFVYGEGTCSRRDTSPDFFWTLDDWTLENTGASTRPYLVYDSGSGTTTPTAAIDSKLARSQAVLSLPSGANVVYARLYWAATRFNSSAGDKVEAPDLTAIFSRPGVAGFESGTALPGTTVTVTEGGTTLCTATTDASGNWSCTSTSLAEGPHNITAVATDTSGNPSQPATDSFTVDSLAPGAPVITYPASGATLTIQRPVFTGTAEPNATIIVSVDGKVIGRVVADGSGNWTLPAPEPLADGAHTVGATAQDAAGNISTAASVPFTIAANPPDTLITAQPPLKDTSTTATFQFSGPSDRFDIGSYDCGLDGRAFVSCDTPKVYTGLTDGRHTFAVRARTYSGIVDPTPATYTWLVGADSDNDGIPDSIESTTGTNPNDDDSDDDGILDGEEDVNVNGVVDPGETDPRKADTDGDGIQDGTEKGVTAPEGTGTNLSVFKPDTDPSTTTDPLDADTDHGGVSDGVEDINHNGRIDSGETDPNDPSDDKVSSDTDGDGIPDATEVALGTDPNDADSDDDGVIDGQDGIIDTDGDGTIDALDPDSDNDGLMDGTELGVTVATAPAGTNISSPYFVPDADPTTKTDPKNRDTDGGGVPDGTEDTNHNGRIDPGETHPLDPSDDVASGGDSDGDGLSDSLEMATGTDWNDDDTDDDGILDGNEDADHDGRVGPDETDPRQADSDGDGLQDGTERGLSAPQGMGTNLAIFIPDADPATRTDPLKSDTDGGGVSDGAEDVNHNGRVDPGETHPLNPTDDLDADGDGLSNSTEWELGLEPFDGDTDDDGILDGADGLRDSDGDGLVDALDPDSDDDGVLDGTEAGVTLANASHWTDTHSSHFVPDGEPSTTTDPRKADSDGDGLSDGEEDRDHDGVFDPEQGETRPTDRDTDQGGVGDGDEVRRGTNPLDGGDDLFITGGGCGATGGSLGGAWLMLLLGLPPWRRSRSRGRVTGSALGSVVLLGVLVAGFAHAQRPPGTSESIDVQQYKPAPGAWDVLGLSSPRMAADGEWNLGFSLGYANNPLGFRRADTGARIAGLLEYQATAEVMGALSLHGRFEMGVSLPMTFQRAAPRDPALPPFLSDGGSGVGLGDLRLVPKMHLLSTGSGLHLAWLAPVLLPTAGGRALRGGSGVGLRPRLLAEWERGRVRVLANVGFNLQREERLFNLLVGNELAYGLGTETSFSLGRHRLAADVTLSGAWGLNRTMGAEARPLELMAAVKYHLTDALAVHVGAGPGLSRGYGTPVYRAFLGLLWTAGERNGPRSSAEP